MLLEMQNDTSTLSSSVVARREKKSRLASQLFIQISRGPYKVHRYAGQDDIGKKCMEKPQINRPPHRKTVLGVGGKPLLGGLELEKAFGLPIPRLLGMRP
jgi:hypothetical protein